MKITDILLEYDRTRAQAAIGPKLWQAAFREKLSRYSQTNVPLDNFEQRLKNLNDPLVNRYMYAFKDKKVQEDLANYALRDIEEADPTTNKKYTQWVARMFASDPPTKMEDIKSTIAEYLYKFNILSRKKLLKPEHQDLNRFKNFNSFMDAVDQYELPEDDSKTGKAEKLYADDTVTVVHPLDEEAACAYGRGTRWCTAAIRSENYFNYYNKQGPLYILLPKSPEHKGEKYQLHFPSDQFMDENDDHVSLVDLIKERFPGLLEFFRKREPNALNDLIDLATDEVLGPILDKIADIILDFIHGYIDEWELHDEYYYDWLRQEGYVDDNGVINDKAPSYLEYDDDVRRFYEDAKDATKLTPDELRNIVREYKKDEPDEPTEINNLENILRWNIRKELGRDNAGALDTFIDRFLVVHKKQDGTWEVMKRAAR